MTTGRKNTIRFFLLRVRLSLLNNQPSTGMSPNKGTWLAAPEYSSDSKPPKTMMEPSSTSTLDSMLRLLVIRPAVDDLV